jgi:predicted transcriptional regulator
MRQSDVLGYLPKPHTPGFNLATPKVFQVHMALLQHAIQFDTVSPSHTASSATNSKARRSSGNAEKNGEVAAALKSAAPKPKSTKKPRRAKSPRPSKVGTDRGTVPQVPGLEAIWTVGQLAHACGFNRNTAGAALKELVILGWIKKSRERHSGGEFGGFRYRLVVPPNELTTTAAHLYNSRLEQTEDRLDQMRQRIIEPATPHEEPDDGGSTSASPAEEPPTIDNSKNEEVI